MPSEPKPPSDMPGSIQAAARVIEAKNRFIELLIEDLARKRDEIARLQLEKERLKITVTDLKAYIARKARVHG